MRTPKVHSKKCFKNKKPVTDNNYIGGVNDLIIVTISTTWHYKNIITR